MAGKPAATCPKTTQLPSRYSLLFPWKIDRRPKAVQKVAANLVDISQALAGADWPSSQELPACEHLAFPRRRVKDCESSLLHNLSCSNEQRTRPLTLTHGESSSHVSPPLGLLKALGLARRQRLVGTLREVIDSDAA